MIRSFWDSAVSLTEESAKMVMEVTENPVISKAIETCCFSAQIQSKGGKKYAIR